MRMRGRDAPVRNSLFLLRAVHIMLSARQQCQFIVHQRSRFSVVDIYIMASGQSLPAKKRTNSDDDVTDYEARPPYSSRGSY